MPKLSRPQYKMLRRISKVKSIHKSELDKEELEMCEYFKTNGYVKSVTRHNPNIDGSFVKTNSLPPDIEISQAGEAALYDFRAIFYKWWIPVIISIIALIVSIASLFVSPTNTTVEPQQPSSQQVQQQTQ